jgi:hypothetical protein
LYKYYSYFIQKYNKINGIFRKSGKTVKGKGTKALDFGLRNQMDKGQRRKDKGPRVQWLIRLLVELIGARRPDHGARKRKKLPLTA